MTFLPITKVYHQRRREVEMRNNYFVKLVKYMIDAIRDTLKVIFAQ
jgi:hypothetical protein